MSTSIKRYYAFSVINSQSFDPESEEAKSLESLPSFVNHC